MNLVNLEKHLSTLNYSTPKVGYFSTCPHCESESRSLIKYGSYYRTSDKIYVRRYQCKVCKKTCSRTTGQPNRYQKRQDINRKFILLYCSNVSLRRIAKILRVSRSTVERRFLYYGFKAIEQLRLQQLLLHELYGPISQVQFDEMETFEHTKLKPVTMPIAVESGSRFILGFDCAQIAAKGLLAEKSIQKYGKRKSFKRKSIKDVLTHIKPSLKPAPIFRTDESPHYPSLIKSVYPNSKHYAYRGKRGCVVGQGELKKTEHDPLFSINHTCATYRGNTSRLIRRTWCTTKKIERLKLHMAMTSVWHNKDIFRRLETGKAWIAQ